MKRLEELAKDVVDDRRQGWVTGRAEAQDVLALIERVRKAERKGAEKAAELVAMLPEKLGHKQVPYRAAIIDAETFIRALLVDPP